MTCYYNLDNYNPCRLETGHHVSATVAYSEYNQPAGVNEEAVYKQIRSWGWQDVCEGLVSSIFILKITYSVYFTNITVQRYLFIFSRTILAIVEII